MTGILTCQENVVLNYHLCSLFCSVCGLEHGSVQEK